VAAVNTEGPGARSNAVNATVPLPPVEPPSAPSLTATAGNGSVTLTWTAPSDDGGATVTGYRIYRRIGTGTATVLTTVGNVQTYTNTGLTNGTTYFYQVAAVNSAGAGPPSNEVSATPATTPSAPRNLGAAKFKFAIRLTWAVPTTDGGSPVTSYIVRRTGGSGPTTYTVSGTSLWLTDAWVARKTTYSYTVVAVNAVGQGPPSNLVTIKSR
jgi:hypothetical protein